MAQNHPNGEQVGLAPTMEHRSAVALEHIAMSLEAIEGHLAQIVGALGGQNTGRQLVEEVQGLKNAVLTRPLPR